MTFLIVMLCPSLSRHCWSKGLMAFILNAHIDCVTQLSKLTTGARYLAGFSLHPLKRVNMAKCCSNKLFLVWGGLPPPAGTPKMSLRGGLPCAARGSNAKNMFFSLYKKTILFLYRKKILLLY